MASITRVSQGRGRGIAGERVGRTHQIGGGTVFDGRRGNVIGGHAGTRRDSDMIVDFGTDRSGVTLSWTPRTVVGRGGRGNGRSFFPTPSAVGTIGTRVSTTGGRRSPGRITSGVLGGRRGQGGDRLSLGRLRGHVEVQSHGSRRADRRGDGVLISRDAQRRSQVVPSLVPIRTQSSVGGGWDLFGPVASGSESGVRRIGRSGSIVSRGGGGVGRGGAFSVGQGFGARSRGSARTSQGTGTTLCLLDGWC